MKKAILQYSAGNIFIRSLGFILLPFYSNLISPSEFGDYSLIMSVYAIFQVLYQLGMQNTLNKFFLEEQDELEKKKVFSTIFLLTVLSGIAFSILFHLFSGSICRLVFDHQQYQGLLNLVVIAVFTECVSGTVVYLLMAQEKSSLVVRLSSFSAVVNVLLNILLVGPMNLGITGIIIAQFVSNVVLMILAVRMVKQWFTIDFKFIIIRKVLLFSLPLLLANLFTAGNNIADRFIINDILGVNEVGLYSFSYRIAMIVGIFSMSFTNAWNPRAIKLYQGNDYSSSFGLTLNKLIIWGMIVIVGVTFFVGVLFDVKVFGVAVLNPVYRAGLVIIVPVMLGYLFKGVTAFYSLYPIASGKSYHILVSDLLALAINVLLNIVLIPKVGIIGAGFATLFAFFGSAVYLALISHSKVRFNYHWRELGTATGVFLLILSLGLYFSNIFLSTGLFFVFCGYVYRFTNIIRTHSLTNAR